MTAPEIERVLGRLEGVTRVQAETLKAGVARVLVIGGDIDEIADELREIKSVGCLIVLQHDDGFGDFREVFV